MRTIPRRLCGGLIVITCCVAVAPRHAIAIVSIRTPIQIPMRDARDLAADLYQPAATGSWPVVLIQTPYNKDAFSPVFLSNFATDPLLKSPDYAFVVLDWRGFFASAGAAYAGAPSRGQDGYDAVEWISAQGWSTGEVGTWGPSALGLVQLHTAAQAPPHLRGCVPIVYHFSELYDLAYPGGVYSRNRNDFAYGTFGGEALVKAHPFRDIYWTTAEMATGDPALINVPMLSISGWYDHETEPTIGVMLAVQAQGGPNAAGKQKLLIGPWSHGNIDRANQGQLSYPVAATEAAQQALAFFDRYLRGIANGFESRPVVRYFVMNEDIWRTDSSWPPSGLTTLTYHLNSSGSLVNSPPMAPAFRDYTADPGSPVPTLFGAVVTEESATQGPGDLTPIESRADVLSFSTPVLTTPLRIEGRAEARLWIECSAVDTDLVVRLTDVFSDGRSMHLVDGIRRASLRNSLSAPQYLTPGTAVEVAVTISPVAVTIPAGHRLRVLVSPSSNDRFDVNPQDGTSLSDDPGAMPVTASVRLWLDADHPSRIILPIRPSGGPSSSADDWMFFN